jgi:serine/threonine protein kinase
VCAQQLGEEIGRGSSGKVYRALNRETGDFRAIKEILTRNMPTGHLEAVQSEIDLLHNLQHDQIVRYFEAIRTESRTCRPRLETQPRASVLARMRALSPRSPVLLPALAPHTLYWAPLSRFADLYLVLEYVENGSLATLIKNFGAFPEHLVCVYVRQVRAQPHEHACLRVRSGVHRPPSLSRAPPDSMPVRDAVVHLRATS